MPIRLTKILPNPGHGPADQISGTASMPLQQFIARLQALLDSLAVGDRDSAVVHGIAGLTATADITISGEQAANERTAYLERFIERIAAGEGIDKDEAAAALAASRAMG